MLSSKLKIKEMYGSTDFFSFIQWYLDFNEKFFVFAFAAVLTQPTQKGKHSFC